MPLEELGQMSMWVNPQLGNGKIQLDLFLDSDENDRYESKDSQETINCSPWTWLSERNMISKRC